MIFIEIDDYRIRRMDPYNFIIEKAHRMSKVPSDRARNRYEERGEGEVRAWYVWKTLGYYSSVKAALRAFPDVLAADPQVTTLQDYFDRWERAIQEIKL